MGPVRRVCRARRVSSLAQSLVGMLAFDARNALFEFHGDFMSFVIRL